MKAVLAKVIELYEAGYDAETLLAVMEQGVAGGFKPGDFVHLNGSKSRRNGQVREIVEGWPEVVFSDGSAFCCRPSTLSLR